MIYFYWLPWVPHQDRTFRKCIFCINLLIKHFMEVTSNILNEVFSWQDIVRETLKKGKKIGGLKNLKEFFLNVGSLIIVTREREKNQSTMSFLYVQKTTNLEIFLNENHIPGMPLTYVVKNKQNDTDIFIRAYQAFNASWLSRVPLQTQERDIFPNDKMAC